MRPLLELVDVTRRFAGVLALEGVGLELRAGEVHALVGENGAGKSTLIHLASALAGLPRILILDEPTGALSESECGWLFAQVERLRRDGVAILYVSHRQEEIFRLADRITVLRDGRRVWTGSKRDTDRQ